LMRGRLNDHARTSVPRAPEAPLPLTPPQWEMLWKVGGLIWPLVHVSLRILKSEDMQNVSLRQSAAVFMSAVVSLDKLGGAKSAQLPEVPLPVSPKSESHNQFLPTCLFYEPRG